MTPADIARLQEWFDIYTRRHYCADAGEQKNILLKVEHSLRVRDIISSLAESAGFSAGQVLLAGAIGLLHDIGRFPQFVRYKTFRDGLSVNHGKLGAEVLAQEGVLEGLPQEERETIIHAVWFHNAFAIPELPSAGMVPFLKLIRDADKLDIWRIFTGFYDLPPEERPSEAGLGLPDEPGYSREMISSILLRQTASMSHMKTVNDFKLMQLSWIADLNFPASFRLLLERKYIDLLISLLPQTEEILKVSQFLREYAAAKAGR